MTMLDVRKAKGMTMAQHAALVEVADSVCPLMKKSKQLSFLAEHRYIKKKTEYVSGDLPVPVYVTGWTVTKKGVDYLKSKGYVYVD